MSSRRSGKWLVKGNRIVYTDTQVLNLKGATKILPPSLMEEIKNGEGGRKNIFNPSKNLKNIYNNFGNDRNFMRVVLPILLNH